MLHYVSINLFLSINATSVHTEQEDQYREVLTVSKETQRKLRQLRAGTATNVVFNSKVPWKIQGLLIADILGEHQCKLCQVI